tara:strand:+ start:391 stop:561 length:171 start_codon:yes stop_codon:yes gene_type:complete
LNDDVYRDPKLEILILVKVSCSITEITDPKFENTETITAISINGTYRFLEIINLII